MLDDNPVLKERLMAIGAFAGIGVFALAAVEVVITGGFDFDVGRVSSQREQAQPSAYVRVVDAAQYVSDRFRDISWDEPMFVGEASAATTEDLVGANDGSTPDVTDQPRADQLYAEAIRLYAQSEDTYRDEAAYEDAAAYDEPNYESESAEVYEDAYSTGEAGKPVSAYGNE